MRKGLAHLSLLAVIFLVAASAAGAAPTDQIHPSFTQNKLGAGTDVSFRVVTSEVDNNGIPPQLLESVTYLPKGMGIHTKGFATCTPALLEEGGIEACPKASLAGPAGISHSIVVLAGEPLVEPTTIQPVNGGTENGHLTLLFYVNGASPVSIQLVLVGTLIPYNQGPYGMKLVVPVPLVPTLPGAPDASVIDFSLVVGTSIHKQGKTISNVTVPTKCPKGGFPWKGEFGYFGGLRASATAVSPCPKT